MKNHPHRQLAVIASKAWAAHWERLMVSKSEMDAKGLAEENEKAWLTVVKAVLKGMEG